MALSDCIVTTDKRKKEVVEHGLVMFPIACYDEDLSSAPIPWHWHDEFEFIIITHGSAHAQVENTALTLKRGEAVFINSKVLHNIGSEKSGAGKCRSLVFHPRLIGASIDSVFWQKLIAPVVRDKSLRYLHLEGSTEWQREVTRHMYAAWENVARETDDFENLARYHLSAAFRILNSNRQAPDLKVSGRDILYAERTKLMMQFIEEHYAQEISLEMIAACASVSKSVCMRCFNQVIGCPPIRYLVRYRIEKAAERLRQTDEKVSDIALSCGFFDISYFTKCFREIKELTPLEYRKAFAANKRHGDIAQLERSCYEKNYEA